MIMVGYKYKKAKSIPSCINRNVTCKLGAVVLLLESAVVRPHLQCPVPGPTHFRKDMGRLDRIQTKVIRGLGSKTYEERPKKMEVI